jgi:protein SCO1/2
MPAMTMPFDVRDTNELAGLEPGQAVEFRLSVADTEAWIDQIRRVSATSSNATGSNVAGTPPTTRLARDVEPLLPGDPLPEYVLTNQFGSRFSTRDFKGQALALTFLFTRCPYPTFCPKMAAEFQAAQQKLLAQPGVTNWQLLTVSFDPEYDKPAILKTYAEAHGYDPRHWTFATGALIDITALGEQFGLAFWRAPDLSISHNLRTAVVNPAGRVQQVFEGNTWTSDELVSALVAAAGKR